MLKSILLVCPLVLGISCGSQSSTKEKDYSITAFQISGSGIPLEGTGQRTFNMSWDVNGDQIYNTQMFLSANKELDESEDELLYSQNCNIPIGACQKAAGNVQCDMTNPEKIACGDYKNNFADLTRIFEQGTNEVFVIMKACHGFPWTCTSTFRPFEYR